MAEELDLDPFKFEFSLPPATTTTVPLAFSIVWTLCVTTFSALFAVALFLPPCRIGALVQVQDQLVAQGKLPDRSRGANEQQEKEEDGLKTGGREGETASSSRKRNDIIGIMSIIACIRRVIRDEGIGSFWKGLKVMWMYFFCLFAADLTEPYMMSSYLNTVLWTAVLYPLELIGSKLMTDVKRAKTDADYEYLGARHVIQRIYNGTGGFFGFYRGAWIQLFLISLDELIRHAFEWAFPSDGPDTGYVGLVCHMVILVVCYPLAVLHLRYITSERSIKDLLEDGLGSLFPSAVVIVGIQGLIAAHSFLN